MKIFYCFNNFSTFGGVERIVINKCNYFIENFNYDITLVTTDQSRSEFEFKVNNKLKHIDLNINYSSSYNKFFLLRYFECFIKLFIHKKRLKKLIEKESPNFVIGICGAERFILPLLNQKDFFILKESHGVRKLPVIKNIYLKKIVYSFFDFWMKKYKKVIILTKEDKKNWKLENIKVIPNSLTFFPKEYSKCNSKKAITIGRLVEVKGYDILIDIWNIVSKKYPDWILEIYGDGQERENLQNKIDALKLKEKIILKGFVKNVKKAYLESSIYILTSRSEGMPMVLLEAMSCGLPVVSFDSPTGPKDIIKDGEDGFLIKFGDIEKMAERIEELISNEEKRKQFGINARKNIQRFSPEKIMNRWKNLFEEVNKYSENELKK